LRSGKHIDVPAPTPAPERELEEDDNLVSTLNFVRKNKNYF